MDLAVETQVNKLRLALSRADASRQGWPETALQYVCDALDVAEAGDAMRALVVMNAATENILCLALSKQAER